MEREKGFVLLKPKRRSNANRIAKAIAMCKGVREVFLTSGEYGFIATVETTNGGLRNVARLVKKTSKCIRASSIVAHYIYRKGGWTR